MIKQKVYLELKRNRINITYLFVVFSISFISCDVSKDIRSDDAKDHISKKEIEKGRALLVEVQQNYLRGKNWDSLTLGNFVQEANWYGKKKISHWDTVPQLFQMKSTLGSDNCEMELRNGPTKGAKFKLNNGLLYQFEGKTWLQIENASLKEKMIFKNYWFQFPFRIAEAEIISYAGKETVDSVEYDLIFATWGKASANKEFDQFMLYVHPDKKQIEHLYFTVRTKSQIASLSAKFDNFKEGNGFYLPYSMYVTLGKPSNTKIRMHENHYKFIHIL